MNLIFAITVAVASAAEPAAPPNIVLIISDDQAYTDFGFMGNQVVQTPHLDRLAEQSARFVTGYVPSSVCRPSLATLLTGQYPHQHGIHFNHPPPGFAAMTRTPEIDKVRFDVLRHEATRLIRAAPSLPRLLAGRGYRCLQTGKYWEGHWRNAGFTEGMTTAEPSGGRYGDKQLAGGDIVAHGNGDHGLVIGRETMQPIDDFLDDCGDTPFFVWYAPFLPHSPHDAPQRFRDLYDGEDVPAHMLPYYASIAQFDETVGHLVGAVEDRGLADRTLFVFVVDNGWVADVDRFRPELNEWDHTRRSKRAPFDDGLRTPTLLRWDGHAVPATHEEVVSSVDLAPTILAAAGVDTNGRTWPGVNLWPVAAGAAQLDPNRAVFGEIYPGDAATLDDPARDLAYRWVRRGRWKLITTHAHGGARPWGDYLAGDALFDVVADSAESRNLIQQEPSVAANLRTLLDEWWDPAAMDSSRD